VNVLINKLIGELFIMKNNFNKFEKNDKQFRDTAKETNRKDSVDYSYYSRILEKPFDSIEELKAAEAAHYAEQRAKEDKAAAKKADAKKVDDAFKALNAARKKYKEDLTALTRTYNESLATIEEAFKMGKNDYLKKLSLAEETYQKALKEFTDKYESYHLTLKDGDFETTISSQMSNAANDKSSIDFSYIADLIDHMFRF
jgi:uncharacterized protein YihD (DUF1040 family)